MNRYIAEVIGTFVLVFGGCGTAVLAGERVGWLGVAFAFGLSLLVMVYAIGPISGCHLNPAVTFGLFLSRKFDGRLVPGYMIAQIAGAILASAILYAIASGTPNGYSPSVAGFAANGFGDHSPGHYGLLAAFLAECILTFFLVFTIVGATDVKAPVGFAGLAIGLVLTLIHLVGIPVTNTSVNPARSIGPAIFVGGWALGQLWLFIVAPLIGAAIAAIIYRAIRVPDTLIAAREAERALADEQQQRRQM
ncbi:MAG TPA: aquaporin Z [Bryobacteraceae bacterium]|jgi:aquaporin Z|nr:aquaporin Z [Bryobacteraceae bacterium]